MGGSRVVLIASQLVVGACRFDVDLSPSSGPADAPALADALASSSDAPNAPPDTLAAAPDAFACPGGYDPWRTSCYRFEFADIATWDDAEAQCENAGAHLVIVDDELENDYVNAQLGGASWIGASDRVTEGSYLTVVGAPLTVTFWRPSQPDPAPGLDCVALWSSHWLVDDCTDFAYRYACEFDGVPAVPASY